MFSRFLVSLLLIGVATAYTPSSTKCPSDSLVRDASSLSDDEETYRVARKVVADEGLKSWLAKTDLGFGTSDLPTVALAISGGGYRSLLVGGGVIQGLDERDSDVSTSGLYQAMTYHAGLSGGGWLLSSFAGNNFPTISWLRDNIWATAFQDSPFDPDGIWAGLVDPEIEVEILSKESAGYEATIVDPYGRLLSYQLFEDGGADITLSSVATLSNFTSHAVPYPLITALGTKVWLGECAPGPNATTYEFSPYEFGSWDSDVSAFAQIEYLGTSMKGGEPTDSSSCTIYYDNLGYILGTSSNLFPPDLCLNAPSISSSNTIIAELANLIETTHELTTSDEYGRYINPFYEYHSRTQVPNSANDISAQETLSLVDGGLALQNVPLFPFLQAARNISTIIVSDNSADTTDNFPNGTAILTTYVQSFNHNLTLMPYIPSVETIIAKGLNKNATFFGCHETNKTTIIYLPNAEFSYDSGTSTAKLEYSTAETADMIANGVQIASQGGNDMWATCLGCAIMHKTKSDLPAACTICLADYCYME